MRTSRQKRWTAVVAGAAVVLFLAGLISLSVSFLPYHTLRVRLDSMAVDGQAEAFTAEFHREIALRLKIGGAFFSFFGVLVLVRLRSLAAAIDTFAAGVRRDVASFSGRLKQETANAPSWALPVLGAITLFGIALRLYFIGQPIRYDEAFTYLNYASASPLKALAYYDTPNNHVLHSLLVMASAKIFGNAEWALRLPSFVTGTLLIPVSCVLVLVLTESWGAGLWSSALIAGSSYLTELTTNARGYTLICLFTIGLLLACRLILQQRKSPGGWLLFVLSAAIGLATVPVMLYPLAMCVVWLALEASRRGLWAGLFKSLVVALGLVAALCFFWYLPALMVTGPGAMLNTGVAGSSPAEWSEAFGRQLVRAAGYYSRDLPLAMLGVLLLGFILGTMKFPRLPLAAVSLVPLIFFQRVVPYSRVFSFLLVVFFIVSAIGLDSLVSRLLLPVRMSKRQLASSLLAAVFCLVSASRIATQRSLLESLDTGLFPEARWAAGFLAGKIDRQQPVVSGTPADNPIIYYAVRLGLSRELFVSGGVSSKNCTGVWVVANRRDSRSSLETVTRAAGISRQAGFDAPRLISAKGQAEIYYVQALNASGG